METATKVKTITKEELNRKMQKGELFQLINVLDPQYYNLGIIKGSKKIPLAELDKRIGELDKSKEVITYCASITCHKSQEAAQLLAAKGFNVSAYEGGVKEWSDAHLPMEKAEEKTGQPEQAAKAECCLDSSTKQEMPKETNKV